MTNRTKTLQDKVWVTRGKGGPKESKENNLTKYKNTYSLRENFPAPAIDGMKGTAEDTYLQYLAT